MHGIREWMVHLVGRCIEWYMVKGVWLSFILQYIGVGTGGAGQATA